MSPLYRIYTAKAPVNIAVIKYWGKIDEDLKIPLNDSLSGTLNMNELNATTSVAMSEKFASDELWLNGERQDLSTQSSALILINEMRRMSPLDPDTIKHKVHIASHNNFPTAAGLASSAAGYACLAFVLGHLYGITDLNILSRLARRGSGSACRSIFGGFVVWERGSDDQSSVARQIVDHRHWQELRVIICVVNDSRKEIPSSKGMLASRNTSRLLKYRAQSVVPERISAMKKAIIDKNFGEFADITMQDSNQFHAICLDTFPPIFYLNETSRQIIKLCSIINSYYGRNKVAYTFDAGPNACIYLQDDFINQFIGILNRFFPSVSGNGVSQDLLVKGAVYERTNEDELDTLCGELMSMGFAVSANNSIDYIINTSLGDGPKLVDRHLQDSCLKQCT